MTTELTTRLRAYRETLDTAIEAASDRSAEYGTRARTPARRRRRAQALVLTAAAAVVAAVALVAGDGTSSVRSTDRATPAAPAAPAGTPAPSMPAAARLLPAEAGWRIVRLDEQVGGGELTYRDGGRSIDLRWEEGGAEAHRREVEEEADESNLRRPVQVAGAAGELFGYADSSEYIALWTAEGLVLELRGLADSPGDFADFAAGLRLVDAETWRQALPASAVPPDQRGHEVDRMLAGLPLPPGFDANVLRGSDLTKERYQLGAQVAGAVACGWLEEWVEAKSTGDEARRARAVEALRSSRSWPVLREMVAEGAYPDVLWEYADAVAGTGTVLGGRDLTVEESYADALGCA